MVLQRWLPHAAIAFITLLDISEALEVNSNQAAQPVADSRRLEDPSRCNGHQRQPLLWRSTTTNQTVYILATYPVPQEDMLPIQPEVQNALECADIAFFELACAPRDMGNYMSHCFHYSAIETHDTLPQRVPTQDYQELQAAIAKLVQTAPPECANLAANLSKAAQALPESRQTLRSFYHQASRVLHPSACQRKEGTEMYQEKLRVDFGSTRPVFGLRDVATECAIYRGGSEDEDAQMVRKMIRDFSSDEWRANLTRNQEAMEDILRCGDLSRLRTMPGVGDLPGLGERTLGQRNPMIADSAIEQIGKSAGKTLLLVLGITHLLDFGDVKSVKTLMAEQGGFAFQRITSGTELSCTASSFSGPGAKEQGTCLLPPGRSQPASCDAFTNAFRKAEEAAAASYPVPNKTLSRESMGRIKKKGNCTTCVRSDDPCTCDITWENDTNFADLCNRTEVDGVRGQVVYMDLTRNPGSVHQGPGLAEKTVRGLYQSCIAMSCDIGFRQEIALRHWYQQDPQLAGGVVQLRFPGQHVVTPGTEKGGIAAWPWWAWLLFILLLTLCVGALLKVFLMPKRKKAVKRAMEIGDPQVHTSVENHFQKVGTPDSPGLQQKVDTGGPGMEDRPPTDFTGGYPPAGGGGDVERRHMGMDGPGYGQDPGYPQSLGGMGGGGMGGVPGGMGGMGGPGGMGVSAGMGMGAGLGAGMGMGLGAGMGPGEPAARPLAGPDEGWPWPSPQAGARAFDFEGVETPMQGPTWQPHLDWPGPLDQPNPFAGFDNTILSQAMQMQQQLGDAGAQAVQQMQQQAQANWRRQNQLPPPSPLQTSASVSLQPPPSPQLGIYGMQPAGQPNAALLAPPLSGRGNSGQMGLSAPTYQPAQVSLGSSGASGPLFPPRGTSTPVFTVQAPPSPQHGYAQLGQGSPLQPGLGPPSGAVYPYGMR